MGEDNVQNECTGLRKTALLKAEEAVPEEVALGLHERSRLS
jgi:hypothetical protein